MTTSEQAAFIKHIESTHRPISAGSQQRAQLQRLFPHLKILGVTAVIKTSPDDEPHDNVLIALNGSRIIVVKESKYAPELHWYQRAAGAVAKARVNGVPLLAVAKIPEITDTNGTAFCMEWIDGIVRSNSLSDQWTKRAYATDFGRLRALA